MKFNLVQPYSINIGKSLPDDFANTCCYYLGYGRNAWHSTWVNKYYPGSLSFDREALERQAEKSRSQGSVFRIQSVPMTVFHYRENSFAVCCINERPRLEYNDLLDRINRRDTPYLWQFFPASSDNWMLLFSMERQIICVDEFEPRAYQSFSHGANYLLGWSPETGVSYPEFDRFVENILDRITTPQYATTSGRIQE